MTKVKTVGIKREPGYLYFIDKAGDVSRCVMNRSGRTKSTPDQEKVAELNIRREKGFLYFIDKQGDISRTMMRQR